jgi:3',5'-cyclic AMP phosphodiesterase CpdA
MRNYTNQITIVHFSDLHFGSKHICNPEDITASSDGIPKLYKLIIDDLNSDFGATFSTKTTIEEQGEPPLIVAATGDFTQRAEHKEFEQALEFLNNISDGKILNQEIKKSDVFIIPGNHDVVFTKPTADERFQQYANFYNKFYSGVRPPLLAHEPLAITQIHTLDKADNKILVAEINCCMYVQDDTLDRSRGQVALDAIAKLRRQLEEIKKNSDFDKFIKVALIHHHVVLIPSFIEPGRGVDSVVHARHLLELLSEFDFHLILHGHKHYPHIFSYDPLPLWNENETKIPQLVIAGGSCGSSELPDSTNSCNTYGVIQIKWHPAAKQARVKIITRGLKRKGLTGQLTPDKWKWETVNISEKIVTPRHTLPSAKKTALATYKSDDRVAYYEKLRGQIPVVEVMPSLIPKQAYEARAWIVSHPNPNDEKLSSDKELIKVEWSAGKNFGVQTAIKETNDNFCISFHYWGAMLIQAKLTFKDGYVAVGFVYARLPKTER